MSAQNEEESKMSSALELEDRGMPQAGMPAPSERSSGRTDLTSPVLQVLFDVLPDGGLPAGTFCAMVTSSDLEPGTCVVLVQLAPMHLRSRPAKRSHLAQLAEKIQHLCFQRHRVSVTEIYWSMAGSTFQPTQAPLSLDERQRIDDATYLMLERAIKEGPDRHKRAEVRYARRRPRFA
ncbi:hypothetical protein [Ramlibacter humi]|uniref:Uncharacterized protein n=1 Tax=Ramlibacter humi TaxID=2530451 RepID=A0A4Z0BDZ3_9BURK|nr:hypothetical protein [Ramlibacter humi]TFY96599.1 hypothetical protein EZ216_20310 [Ramlibacter humi]